MSYTDLLINTCDVERFTEAIALDAYGIPEKTWTVHLDDEACRFMSGRGGRGIANTGMEVRIGAEVVIADFKLFLGDVDITEQDRVVVDGVTYQILIVAPVSNGFGNHHKECWLRTVR